MIPMDWTQLNRVPLNPPCIEKLDMVKTNSASPPNSTGSEPTAPHPLTGGVSG